MVNFFGASGDDAELPAGGDLELSGFFGGFNTNRSMELLLEGALFSTGGGGGGGAWTGAGAGAAGIDRRTEGGGGITSGVNVVRIL